MLRFLLALLILVKVALGYVDSDLDGVDDSVDKCPNTPFDVLVNADGCPLKEKGNYYIKVSSSLANDKSSTSITSFITFAYANQNWYFSITGSYILKDINGGSKTGDSFVFGSYVYPYGSLYVQIGANIKIPTSENSKSFDFTPSILADYYFNSTDLFIYLNYTITGEKNLKNNYSVSVGIGNQFTETFYSSVSLDYSSASVKGYSNEKYISIYAIYDITDRVYFSVLYSYGINSPATDHYLFGKVAYRF